MSFCASVIFLFLFSLLSSFKVSAQEPYFLYHACRNTTTYTRNSTYFTNLKTLLSSLSSPEASYSTGFQEATTGRAPNKVTGLFLCRGDVSLEVCRSCVSFAVVESLARCPNERKATLYYQECILRYSHKKILSTVSYDGGYILMNPNNISSNQKETDRFIGLVSSTMKQAAFEAANSSRKFYTTKANWTAFNNLYMLFQCTPDLRRQGCLSCLQYSIDYIPHYKFGARLLWPSCNLRYELNEFYNEPATYGTPPRSAPSPPVGSARNLDFCSTDSVLHRKRKQRRENRCK